MAEPTIIDVGNGGQGADTSILFDPHHIRETAKLAERAIREEWPIDFETRSLVINKMKDILENSEEERNQIGAGKVIIAADTINAKRQSESKPKTVLHGMMDSETNTAANIAAKDALDAADLVAAAGLLDASRVGVANSRIFADGDSKQLDTA